MIRRVSRATVCLPTYDERENLEPMVRALGDVLGPDDRRARDRRQLAGRNRRDRRPARGRARLGRRPPPAAQGGARPRLPGRLPAGARRRRRARAGAGLRLLARPGGRPAPDRGRRRAPTSCSARATSRAAARRTGGSCAARSRAGARCTRRSCSDSACATSPEASSATAARCSRRSTWTRSTPAATRSRSRRPTGRSRAGFRVVEVPIRFTDREVGGSKMSRAIVLEAVWKVPALRLAALRGRL